jgi:hypothetical protein
MAQAIKITDAQMTALISAGVIEMPQDFPELAAAIKGNRMDLTANGDGIARAICDLSNDADEQARDLEGECATWAAKDARVLANLYSAILRQIH